MLRAGIKLVGFRSGHRRAVSDAVGHGLAHIRGDHAGCNPVGRLGQFLVCAHRLKHGRLLRLLRFGRVFG